MSAPKAVGSFETAVSASVEGGACPHLAVLLRGVAELPAVLASFFALGAKRNGWLVHRALPGRAEAERELLERAGLDVTGLEAAGQLVVRELDPRQPVEDYGRELEPDLAAALARGLTALWYARFAVGSDVADYDQVLLYDRHWERRFAGRPVVTLCPFIVEDLSGPATLGRLASLAEFHDPVLVAGDDGYVGYAPA